jgi:hypothetical protein
MATDSNAPCNNFFIDFLIVSSIWYSLKSRCADVNAVPADK